MNRFLAKCVVFLFPVLLVLGGVELYARHLPNSYKQKEQWMQQHAGEVETLILGNSHGLFGIRPELFPKKTYNLCNVSQTFEYDEYLLKRYLHACKSLKDIILIVDNSNLFDSPLEQTESFRCTYYRLYMGYPKHRLWSKYGLELLHTKALIEKLQRGGDSCEVTGWNSSYTKDSRLPENLSYTTAISTATKHQCKDWRDATENEATLNRIVALCKSRHIRLVLVQAPVTRAYYSQISKKQLAFINHCAKSNGIVCVDYSLDSHFSDDDFFDVDHLADQGATKWSKLLAERFFD